MEKPYVACFSSQIYKSFLEFLFLHDIRQLFSELLVLPGLNWTFSKITCDF